MKKFFFRLVYKILLICVPYLCTFDTTPRGNGSFWLKDRYGFRTLRTMQTKKLNAHIYLVWGIFIQQHKSQFNPSLSPWLSNQLLYMIFHFSRFSLYPIVFDILQVSTQFLRPSFAHFSFAIFSECERSIWMRQNRNRQDILSRKFKYLTHFEKQQNKHNSINISGPGFIYLHTFECLL